MEKPTDLPTSETPSQRQARLRREKREKKILSGATSRLDKITSLSGRPNEPSSSTAPDSSPDSSQAATNGSQSHLPAPLLQQQGTKEGPTQSEIEASMRQLLRGNHDQAQIDPPPISFSSYKNEASQARPASPPSDDPMMHLLQQMMGVQGSSATAGEQQTGLPPGLASMLGGMPNASPDAESQPPTNAYIWKILHAVFALALGLYVLCSHGFSGSLTSRLRVIPTPFGTEGGLFWIFVTVELCLQSTRYLLQGGRSEEGMIKAMSGFLPTPWNQRLLLAGSYSAIWTTLVADSMVLIWMLGTAAWWRGDLV